MAIPSLKNSLFVYSISLNLKSNSLDSIVYLSLSYKINL